MSYKLIYIFLLLNIISVGISVYQNDYNVWFYTAIAFIIYFSLDIYTEKRRKK